MYTIAEIGANHNGSMDMAQELVKAAEKAGVSAVKFQSWTPESLYAQRYLDENSALHKDMVKHSLSIDKIRYLASKTNVGFICSVFSCKEVDELEDVVDLYKVASMDLTNIRLLKHIANTRKPVVLSCGMGTIGEISTAYHILKQWMYRPLTLLHCVSLYPPRLDQINLGRMDALRKFRCNVGYSDHTEGITVPLAAVAMGADCIEKHFTLDKDLPGWDHRISATPDEMAQLVRESKMIELAQQESNLPDIDARKAMRRSVVSARDIYSGERVTDKDVIYRRPGTGLLSLPRNATAKRDIPGGCLISGDDLR